MMGEFMSCFKAADVNNNGVLEKDEFRVWMTKMNAAMKARFGEAIEVDDRECEQWFNAHNGLTPHCDGVSLEDFMQGDTIMKEIAQKFSVKAAKMAFDPLMTSAMKRMESYKPETQKKLKASMDAEFSNPQMYKQMMTQFVTTFKACDVNKDGVLKRDEFLNFMEQNNENRKKMFGESTMGDEHENGQWYDAYNLMSPTKEGVSMEDFGAAMAIIRNLIIRKTMEPLMREVFLRFGKFKKETMAKI
jgi:predicted DNA-binding protein YlxM (UPF0122 family)